jgi:hypothetical protein
MMYPNHLRETEGEGRLVFKATPLKSTSINRTPAVCKNGSQEKLLGE